MSSQKKTDLLPEAKLNVSIHNKAQNIASVLITAKIIVVGAGLGGVGAAISCFLAGHSVHILESTSEIGEVILSSDYFTSILTKTDWSRHPSPPQLLQSTEILGT